MLILNGRDQLSPGRVNERNFTSRAFARFAENDCLSITRSASRAYSLMFS